MSPQDASEFYPDCKRVKTPKKRLSNSCREDEGVVVCAGEFVGVAGGVHIPKRPDSRIGISLVPFRRT